MTKKNTSKAVADGWRDARISLRLTSADRAAFEAAAARDNRTLSDWTVLVCREAAVKR